MVLFLAILNRKILSSILIIKFFLSKINNVWEKDEKMREQTVCFSFDVPKIRYFAIVEKSLIDSLNSKH